MLTDSGADKSAEAACYGERTDRKGCVQWWRRKGNESREDVPFLQETIKIMSVILREVYVSVKPAKRLMI